MRVVSTSLFNKFISAKNTCVIRLNSSTSSFLKDWSSSFVLKASLQVLFFGMEKHAIFETELDFTESLSIRSWKVYQNFLEKCSLQENLVIIYELPLFQTLFFYRFKVSIDAIIRVSNFLCSIFLGASL